MLLGNVFWNTDVRTSRNYTAPRLSRHLFGALRCADVVDVGGHCLLQSSLAAKRLAADAGPTLACPCRAWRHHAPSTRDDRAEPSATGRFTYRFFAWVDRQAEFSSQAFAADFSCRSSHHRGQAISCFGDGDLDLAGDRRTGAARFRG